MNASVLCNPEHAYLEPWSTEINGMKEAHLESSARPELGTAGKKKFIVY